MATKNIARTILEGGRSDSSKSQRRWSNRADRHRAQRVLRDALVAGEDDPVFTAREAPFYEHADKVRPTKAWLLHHALGKTHAEAIGLFCARFDRRNLAQRHLLCDHLVPQVQSLYNGAFTETFRFRGQVYRYLDGRLAGPFAD